FTVGIQRYGVCSDPAYALILLHNARFEKQGPRFKGPVKQLVHHRCILPVYTLHAVLPGPQTFFLQPHDFSVPFGCDDRSRSQVKIPRAELGGIDRQVEAVDAFFQDLLGSLFVTNIDENIYTTLEVTGRIEQRSWTRQNVKDCTVGLFQEEHLVAHRSSRLYGKGHGTILRSNGFTIEGIDAQ